MRRMVVLVGILLAVIVQRSSASSPTKVPKYDSNGALVDSASIMEDADGNVGIGTSTPIGQLHVKVGTDQHIVLRTDTANTAQIISTNDAHDAYYRLKLDADPLLLSWNSGGNVGIDTYSPAAALDVNGTARVSGNGWVPDDGSGLELAYNPATHRGIVEAYDRTDVAGLPLEIWGYPTYMLGGYVGIGTTSPAVPLDVVGNAAISGNLSVAGNLAAKYQDVAEWVDARDAVTAGTVVVLSADDRNFVRESDRAYDTAVAGVVSPRPGLTLGERAPGRVLVAHTGRVRVKVDATYGAVHVGDLLVTSATPGYAMRSMPLHVDGEAFHRPGTVLGKAIEPLETGQGEILVLVTLQ